MSKKFIDALTPSIETKTAYSDEFHFNKTFTDENGDENGDEKTVKITVPWTTIKEIMNAIRVFALNDRATNTIENLRKVRKEGKMVNITNMSDEQIISLIKGNNDEKNSD